MPWTSLQFSPDSAQSQGLIASLVTKIINNLQVTVRNIHIRYEDKLSVPGVSGLRFKAGRGTNSKRVLYQHPFAAGVTLAGFTAVSVNENWQPAFIDTKAGAVHKVGPSCISLLHFSDRLFGAARETRLPCGLF